ncbi:MAG: bifunctional glutamate N-acetyltransferase/amino-acid acetyltransferase ArgJ [bacterium]|nr:bifunctional glutamate N-acetyltransferase/amino-acid acetyltransferase ArgJ [bacterium]
MSVNENVKILESISGLYLGGYHAGIKNSGTKKDIAYFFAPQATGIAGVFTKNNFFAPSVAWSRNVVKSGKAHAIIVNSGNANAGNGRRGEEDVEMTAREAAALLGIRPAEVAVASTGKIGVPMPMEKFIPGVQQMLAHWKQTDARAAAEAIMTTDTVMKLAGSEFIAGSEPCVVAGMTKGSGMIAPNMATTLTFIATDLNWSHDVLQHCLREVNEATFNMVSVDTDTSSNDMVLLLATGAKNVPVTTEHRTQFVEALFHVMKSLAVQIVQDGEGATKLIEARVSGALNVDEARRMAKSIIDSPLVKTAVCGEDPNWGRVLAAAGKVENTSFAQEKVSLSFGTELIVVDGEPLCQPREVYAAQMKGREVLIALDLNQGEHEATAWGCDLTHGYIDINTEYS